MIRKDFSRCAERRRGDRLSKSACATGGSSTVRFPSRRFALRVRGAWTAECRSVRATPVVPCETSFPNGTISCLAVSGTSAFDSLHATNNFPELTGRLCPGAV